MLFAQPAAQAALVEMLLPADSEKLANLIQTHQLTLDTIQHLKEYSAQFHLTEPERALQIARVAYQVSQHLPPPAVALGAWTLGNALMFVDRFAEADQFFQQARTDYLRLGQRLDAARMSVAHVFVLAYSGQSAAALALAAEAEPLLVAASQTDEADLRRLGNLLLNRGVAHEVRGEYEEALAVYERQMKIAQSLHDPLMLAQMKNNQAYALVQLGSLTEAVAAYQEAETLFTALNAAADLLRLYNNYAVLLAMLARYPEARALQDKATALIASVDGVEQQRHWLTIQRVIVDLQAGWPVTTASLAALQAAQRAFAQYGPTFGAGLAWLIIGRCYSNRQEWSLAHHAFDQACQLAQTHADRSLQFRALHGLAQLAEAQDQLAEAGAAYIAAIQQIELIRDELQIETLRADFLTDKLVVYQDLVRLYVQMQQPVLAFEIVERAKARLLAEKLAFRLQQEAGAVVLSADEQLHTLTAQLKQTLQQLDALYAQARLAQWQEGSSPTGDTAATLTTLEHQVQTLIHQIQRRQPLFTTYATGEAKPLAEIQPLLHDRLLLQYHINRNEVWVFLVDHTGVFAHYRLATCAEVEGALQALRAVIEQTLQLAVNFGAARAVRYLPALRAEADRLLATLYALLIQPLAGHLSSTAALLIAPDQALHYIPFHALYDGQAYLLENFTISYTPNATVFDLCHQRSPQGQGALLFGYDNQALTAISTELATLHQLLPKADVFSGDASRAGEFLQRAANYRLIHVAAHAQFRVDHPLLSSLTLADRRLTLAEIANLQLNAELVILSGCETGHGQLRGADLLSLAGGFLSAGASSLLVTLWRVEDTVTAAIMAAFYRALVAGVPRAEALRQAQLQILHQGRHASDEQQLYSHPAYWAPFILIGNCQPIDNFT